jgi:hypothetical protein
MENNKTLTIIGGINLVVMLTLTGLVAKVALSDTPTPVAGPVQVDVQPVKYDYMVDSIPDLEWSSKGQALGQEGWEMVFARRASDGNDNMLYECIFQRQSRVPDL